MNTLNTSSVIDIVSLSSFPDGGRPRRVSHFIVPGADHRRDRRQESADAAGRTRDVFRCRSSDRVRAGCTRDASLAAFLAPPLAVWLTPVVAHHIAGLIHPAIGGAVGERWRHPTHHKHTKDKRA